MSETRLQVAAEQFSQGPRVGNTAEEHRGHVGNPAEKHWGQGPSHTQWRSPESFQSVRGYWNHAKEEGGVWNIVQLGQLETIAFHAVY